MEGLTVLEYLDEIEDIVETAASLPLSGKVMVDRAEVMEIIEGIRRVLPDDMKDARWIKDERNRILAEAKQEYEKMIVEANKEAEFLVDQNDITLKAKKRADKIRQQAEEYTRELKLRTYDYMDQQLYKMQGAMMNTNEKYLHPMYANVEKTMDGVCGMLEKNREELKKLASRTESGEDWIQEDR